MIFSKRKHVDTIRFLDLELQGDFPYPPLVPPSPLCAEISNFTPDTTTRYM